VFEDGEISTRLVILLALTERSESSWVSRAFNLFIRPTMLVDLREKALWDISESIRIKGMDSQPCQGLHIWNRIVILKGPQRLSQWMSEK
jgi:hypothetical protein